MKLQPVISEAVAAVGYDAATRTMRVEFRGGGVYDYLDVAPELFAEMQRPHPWHSVGRSVLDHEYRRVD